MNNQIILASKTNLPFLSYFCRSQQNDSVKTGSFKRRKSKGSARPSHATPRIRRLKKQNRLFPNLIACASSDSLEPNRSESELQTYYHI